MYTLASCQTIITNLQIYTYVTHIYISAACADDFTTSF